MNILMNLARGHSFDAPFTARLGFDTPTQLTGKSPVANNYTVFQNFL